MAGLLRDRETELAALRTDLAAAHIAAAKKEAELLAFRELVSQLRGDVAESRQAILELRQAAEVQQGELTAVRNQRDELKQARANTPDRIDRRGEDMQEWVMALAKDVAQLRQDLRRGGTGGSSAAAKLNASSGASLAAREKPIVQPAKLDTGKADGQEPSSPASVLMMRPTVDLSNEPVEIIVQPGDTLSKLARRHRTTVDALQGANALKGDRLEVGQVLFLPKSTDSAP